MSEHDDDDEDDYEGCIVMTTALFIRLLEYAHEDAKDDLDLHYLAERASAYGGDDDILDMDDYKELIGKGD